MADRRQPTRIPMGGVDKCLLCGWQGQPDEPHGCPRYRDSAASPSPRYRTIVADPPWDIQRSFGGANWAKGEREKPQLDYETMSLDDIAALPIRELAEKNAHLYVWTTQRHLRDTYWITEAWGFKPVATLTWCKPHGGFVGGTFYSNTEFVVFGRRGSLAAHERVNSQWFNWPRGEHSAKPEAFLDMVERVSPAPRLEMFARRQRLGWDTWGNEALPHVEMSA